MSTERASREPMRCKSDWEARYRDADTPWNLGTAPPHLEQLASALAADPRRVFVPGAGQGHDAIGWARAGHAVTAIDIAPTAVDEARALGAAAGVEVAWRVGDLFDLPEELAGAFDIVWEQTCLCALPPERHPEYAAAVARVLAPSGVLHGVLWEHGHPGGPPWNITEDHLRSVLADRFEIEALTHIPDWGEARWNEFTVQARRR